MTRGKLIDAKKVVAQGKSPALEIRLMARQMESVATYPTIRLALRMILLTLVRKSELIEATRDEVDFESATWTIPKQRMKGRNPHVVYLSRQALDIFVALHTCAGGSKFVLPSRYDADRCMSKVALNRVTQIVAERAKVAGLPLEPFTVHDLRRHMLQEWASMVEAWIDGQTYVPTLMPKNVIVPTLSVTA